MPASSMTPAIWRTRTTAASTARPTSTAPSAGSPIGPSPPAPISTISATTGPGLKAAAEHGVRHPWIEAGIGKQEIRRIAAAHGLLDLAELPSSPCLSSRIETGIPVTVGALAVIDRLERELRDVLAPETLRCRLRPFGIEVELDEAALGRADHEAVERLARAAMAAGSMAGEVRLAPYRRGSAFRRPTSA